VNILLALTFLTLCDAIDLYFAFEDFGKDTFDVAKGHIAECIDYEEFDDVCPAADSNGIIGYSRRFRPTQEAHFTLFVPGVSLSPNFAVRAWVRPLGETELDKQSIVRWMHDDEQNIAFSLHVSDSGGKPSFVCLYDQDKDHGGLGAREKTETSKFEWGDWYHVVCTRSNVSKELAIWVDGEKRSSTVTREVPRETAHSMGIGNYSLDGTIWPSSFDDAFYGNIDELMVISTRSLADHLIQKDYERFMNNKRGICDLLR